MEVVELEHMCILEILWLQIQGTSIFYTLKDWLHIHELYIIIILGKVAVSTTYTKVGLVEYCSIVFCRYFTIDLCTVAIHLSTSATLWGSSLWLL
ncbi:MAG: hypothetical protein QXZ41_07280 [Ignisphaera sp.]|uniref:Uncharacterized protein n=1 Tax=Ignisphaera aggregans TaxID=334771 RepID=A0A832CYG3_9CREN